MLGIKNPVLWLAVVVVFAIVAFLVRDLFNPEARARRRREKSHRPVISSKPGPSVKLAVDVGKRRRGRKS